MYRGTTAIALICASCMLMVNAEPARAGGPPTVDASDEALERAVVDGLEWLVEFQEKDGGWAVARWGGKQGEEATVGVTGLSVLALIEASYEARDGAYKDAILKGLQFLASQQAATGEVGANTGYANGGGYNHGIAGLALVKGYAALKDRRLAGPAAKAAWFSAARYQHADGGWRYSPGSTGDTSVSGWFIKQLAAAEAARLRVDKTWRVRAARFLAGVTEGAPPRFVGGGRGCYQPGREYTATMTASVMGSWMALGVKPTDPRIRGGSKFLFSNMPKSNTWGGWYYYLCYFGTATLSEAGGPTWTLWRARVTRSLCGALGLEAAGATPGGAGAFPVIADGTYGGAAYATAMGVLTFQMCLEHSSETK